MAGRQHCTCGPLGRGSSILWCLPASTQLGTRSRGGGGPHRPYIAHCGAGKPGTGTATKSGQQPRPTATAQPPHLRWLAAPPPLGTGARLVPGPHIAPCHPWGGTYLACSCVCVPCCACTVALCRPTQWRPTCLTPPDRTPGRGLGSWWRAPQGVAPGWYRTAGPCYPGGPWRYLH